MISAAVDLETFIRSEIGRQGKCDLHVFGGPTVSIDARALAVLSSILGDIVASTARIDPQAAIAFDVVWSCDHQGQCVVELSLPSSCGARGLSGTSAIRSKQRLELEQSGAGMIRCEMSDSGARIIIRCEMSDSGARIIIPARYIASRRTLEDWSKGQSVDPLRDRSVLVVEDQLLIALDLETLLLEHGAASVRLCGTVEDALQSIRMERPDIAILDVNLGSTTSFPVAFELQRLGVPLIFATGYGNEVDVPPALRSIPLVAKPYCLETIREGLRSTFAVHA